jgi:ParB family chromosome partitioning protein
MSDQKIIPIEKIHVPTDRLREFDENYAKAIASSITDGAPNQDILVRYTSGGKQPYTLVDGEHRLGAMKLLGHTEIPVKVRQLTKQEARLAEIDSNLVGYDLTALDRAIFMAERKKVYEALYPETKHGGDRRSEGFDFQEDKVVHLKFTEDAAEKVGLGYKTIQRSIQIAKNLDANTIKALRGTPEANNASRLLSLARMEPEKRSVAINIFKETGDLADAIYQSVGKNTKKAPEAELKYAALVAAWKAAPQKAKLKFIETQSDELKKLLELEG